MQLTRRAAITGLSSAAIVGGWLATQTPTVRAYEDISRTYDIDTDDGMIDYVAIWGDVRLEWSGFEKVITHFRINWDLTIVEDDDPLYHKSLHSSPIVDLSRDNFAGPRTLFSGPGKRGYIERAFGLDKDGNRDPSKDWHIIARKGFESHDIFNTAPAKYVRVDEEGKTRTFLVTLVSTFGLYSGNPNNGGGLEASHDVYIQPTLKITNLTPKTTTEDEDGQDGLEVVV